MPRILPWLAALSALSGALASCERSRGKPAPRPASVVVDFARASRHSGDGLRAYVGEVQPLAKMMLDDDAMLSRAASKLGLTGVDGIDRDAPLHVLVVEAGDGLTAVLVAKVGDTKKLDASKTSAATIEARDGWAVIGRDAKAVGEVAPYALSALTEKPATDKPTVTCYLAAFADKHADQMRAALTRPRSDTMSKMMTSYVDAVLAVAHDVTAVTASVDADAKHLDVALDLDVAAGSRFAQFAAAQHASDYHLATQLPATHSMLALVGHIDAGPYRAAIHAMMPQLYGAIGPQIAPDYDALMNASSGEIAMTGSVTTGGMTMSQIAELADAPAAELALGHLLQVFSTPQQVASGPMTMSYVALPGVTDRDGAQVHSLRADIKVDGAAEPAMAKSAAVMAPGGTQDIRVATTGHALLVMLGDDAETRVETALDVVHGKRPPDPPFGLDLLDASRARKDSLALLFDLAAIKAMALHAEPTATAPILMSFGAAGGRPVIHLVAPTASVQALVR